MNLLIIAGWDMQLARQIATSLRDMESVYSPATPSLETALLYLNQGRNVTVTMKKNDLNEEKTTERWRELVRFHRVTLVLVSEEK